MEDTVTAASRATGMKTFDDKTDLLRDAEGSFYGGGAAPIPTPTPTPAPQSMDTSNLIFNPNIPEPRNPNAFAFFGNKLAGGTSENSRQTDQWYSDMTHSYFQRPPSMDNRYNPDPESGQFRPNLVPEKRAPGREDIHFDPNSLRFLT